MPSEWRLGEVLRKLRRLRCRYRRTGNNYVHVKREVHGRVAVANFPTVRGRRVKPRYVKQLKAQLSISDEEWESA